MLFIFSTPVLIRHLWQFKTVVFPALVSNMLCSIVNNWVFILESLLCYTKMLIKVVKGFTIQ